MTSQNRKVENYLPIQQASFLKGTGDQIWVFEEVVEARVEMVVEEFVEEFVEQAVEVLGGFE